MFGNTLDSDNRPICPFCDKPVTQDDVDNSNSCGAMSPKSVGTFFIVHKACFRMNQLISDMGF